MGDKQRFREDFTNVQSVCDNGGSITGSVTINNGVATFDGSTGQINYSNDRINVGVEDFTVVFDVKRDGLPTLDAIAGNRTGTSAASLGWTIFLDSSGQLNSRISDGGDSGAMTGGANICDGEFHRVVVSYDRSGNISRYVDGASYGTDRSISAIGNIAGDQDFVLGDFSGAGGFGLKGSLKNMRVYRYTAWTAEEALDDYENDTYSELDASKALVYLPLLSHYNDGTNEVTKNLGTGDDALWGDGAGTGEPGQLNPKGIEQLGGDYLSLPNYDITGSEGITMISLVSLADGATQAVMALEEFGVSVGGLILYTSGEYRFYAGGADLANAAKATYSNPQKITSVMGTSDGTDTEIYINGIKGTDATSPQPLSFSSSQNLSAMVRGDYSANIMSTGGKIYANIMFPFKLTARQARWMHERLLTEINLCL
jgi:hypothetical protein